MRFGPAFISAAKRYIHFEPAYVLFNLVMYMADLADTNLYLQKACRFNATSEPDIRTPCDSEKAGIDFVATVNSKFRFAGGFVTVIVIVLMSAWTDKAAGRHRFCVLFPTSIKLFQLTLMCLHSYFWYWPVMLAVVSETWLFSAACLRLAAVIYVCGISTTEERTFRLTLLYVLQTATNIVSSGSSGYLLRHLGFFYTYLLCIGLTVVAMIYFVTFAENTSAAGATTAEKTGCKKKGGVAIGFAKGVCQFFDVRSVVEAFQLVFRKRNGNERLIIGMLSAVNILVWTAYIGEHSTLYLYLRYKFGWNEQDYGLYLLYKTFGIGIGCIICLAMNKYLKITDSAIATFAAFWDILAAFAYFFASENWHLYLIPILDLFHGFALVVCDSLQSQFFESNEFGRLFCVHVALNIALPFAFPAYNYLFKSTLDSMPGAIFLLTSTVNTFACIMYGICYILLRNMPKKD